MNNLIEEIRVHWVLEDCEGILRLLEIFEDEHKVYLVLEYQESGCLLEHIADNGKSSEE